MDLRNNRALNESSFYVGVLLLKKDKQMMFRKTIIAFPTVGVCAGSKYVTSCDVMHQRGRLSWRPYFLGATQASVTALSIIFR